MITEFKIFESNEEQIINNVFNNLEIIIKKIIDKCGVSLINDIYIRIDGCNVSCDTNEFFLYVPVEYRDSLVTQKNSTGRYGHTEYNYSYFNYDDGFFKFFITIGKNDRIFSSIFINNKKLSENIDVNLVKNFIEKLNYIVNTNDDVLKIQSSKYNI